MKIKTILIMLIIVIAMLLTIPQETITFTPLWAQTPSQFTLHNIFPTLVPTNITYFHNKPIFVIHKKDILTPSGTLPSPGVIIDHILTTASHLMIVNGTNVYRYDMTTGSIKVTATGVVKPATDLSGYAIWKHGYLEIYTATGHLLYKVSPPITDFSITPQALYLLKDEKLFTIVDGAITTTCTAGREAFSLMTSGTQTFIIGKNNIHLAGCKESIPYPQLPKYITYSNHIYMLSQSGKVFVLNGKRWQMIYQTTPYSKLLKNFLITPTQTLFITNTGDIKRYSSWIKAFPPIKVTIDKGEAIVHLKPQLAIRLSDQDIVNSTATQTADDNCENLSTSYMHLAGCSPSYIATYTSTHIKVITASGTAVATVPLPYPPENIAYYAGTSYITTPYGVYQLNVYKKKITLQINSKEVSINGKSLTIDVAPRILPPGRTFVPLRFVSESLGAQVKWNEDDRSVEIIKGKKHIVIWIGKKDIKVNGQWYKMDVAPFIDVNAGRTLVPIRFIAEYLGSFVYWINRTREVIIIQ